MTPLETFERLTRGVSSAPKRARKAVKPHRFVAFERREGRETAYREFVALQLPIIVVSEANTREHWRVKAARAKAQRETVGRALRGHVPQYSTLTRYDVQLTRLAPGTRPMDGDNLQRGFKAVRDEVAACIGIDDGDPRVTWTYEQKRSPAYGVRVKVVAR